MTFYGTTATAAGIVVPKKYVTQVGDEGFLQQPSAPATLREPQTGVVVVVEGRTRGYWRRVPLVKRYVMKSVPEGTTRVEMLKAGEADHRLCARRRGRAQREARLTVAARPSKHASILRIEFAEQWDPKSPVARQTRRGSPPIHALNRQAINEVSCLGLLSADRGHRAARDGVRAAGAAAPCDPQKAKRLLAEAGYPNGIDVGVSCRHRRS
jgi:peptide/nickel transport system substrate-binding protein